jgi:hypothetical protein
MRTCYVLLVAAAASAMVVFCPAPIQAEQAVPEEAVVKQSPAPAKTGKERLSDKASDEQRVDNCKVPLERQGTKARPKECPQAEQKVPVN